VKVTPLDIRQKEFKRAVRGYAEEEVDLFLDEIADELERLSKESAELVERLHRQEGELSSNQQLRDALEKILVSAQLQADETRAKAAREAEQIVLSAESRARELVSESYTEVQRVQQALVQLKHLEEDFRSKFQSLLQNHLRVLAEPAIALPVTETVVAPTPTPAVTLPPRSRPPPRRPHRPPRRPGLTLWRRLSRRRYRCPRRRSWSRRPSKKCPSSNMCRMLL